MDVRGPNGSFLRTFLMRTRRRLRITNYDTAAARVIVIIFGPAVITILGRYAPRNKSKVRMKNENRAGHVIIVIDTVVIIIVITPLLCCTRALCESLAGPPIRRGVE